MSHDAVRKRSGTGGTGARPADGRASLGAQEELPDASARPPRRPAATPPAAAPGPGKPGDPRAALGRHVGDDVRQPALPPRMPRPGGRRLARRPGHAGFSQRPDRQEVARVRSSIRRSSPGCQLLYPPSSPTGHPDPTRDPSPDLHRPWVGQYTIGPPRFSDRASTIHIYGVDGGSNQFLKGKFQMALFPPADPSATPTPGNPYANQMTGVAGLFTQNYLQSGGSSCSI